MLGIIIKHTLNSWEIQVKLPKTETYAGN